MANHVEILLAHKRGHIINRIRSNSLTFSLGISPISNKIVLGLTSGKILNGFVNVFSTLQYKNFVLDFPNENTVKISDIHSNYKESIDFPDKQILYIEPFNDKILFVLQNQCQIYKCDNLVTPIIFETNKDPFMFAQLSSNHILLAF